MTNDKEENEFDDPSTSHNWKELVERIARNRELVLLFVILVLSAVMSILFPSSFTRFGNFKAILLSLSKNGILVIGMMFLLVSGVFDLSIGSNLAVGGAVAAYSLKAFGMPIPISILAGLAASGLGGLFNGLVVTKLNVNALITTLATMGIFRGIAMLVAGTGISFLPEGFTAIGQFSIFGFQLPILYLLGLTAISSYLLAKSRYLRQFYFIGGNREAAELSGIQVDRVQIVNFVIMGLLAGFVGILQTARLGGIMGTTGEGTVLNVIAAAIIGGASLNGGRGSVLGAFLGAAFMALVNNMMVIAGVGAFYQRIVIGFVLLVAVITDSWITNYYQAD